MVARSPQCLYCGQDTHKHPKRLAIYLDEGTRTNSKNRLRKWKAYICQPCTEQDSERRIKDGLIEEIEGFIDAKQSQVDMFKERLQHMKQNKEEWDIRSLRGYATHLIKS